MVIQCTCDCNCSDSRDNRSIISCLLPGRSQPYKLELGLGFGSSAVGGDDMEHRIPYYRRLSNTSSALYGSCPQLLPSSSTTHISTGNTTTTANSNHHSCQRNLKNRDQSINLEERQYSSLVRPKQRSPVLCNKSWWVSCPRLSHLPTATTAGAGAAEQTKMQSTGTPSRHCGGVGGGTTTNTTTPPTLPRFPSKRHCDNFGSYATLPTIEQQQQQQLPHCSRHGGGVGGGVVSSGVSGSVMPAPPPPRYANPNLNGCCYMYNPMPTHHQQQQQQQQQHLQQHHHLQHQHQHQHHPHQYAPPQYCLCDNWYHQSQQHLHQQHHQQRSKPLLANGGCYFGYDAHHALQAPPPPHPSHITDEEDSAFPGLADREFHLLHRNIPALRRTGVDTTRIRQYFYPDGGWGWIICGVSFLVHVLTTGLQLSYGLLLFYAVEYLHNASGVELLGALSWSVSMVATSFVVSLCRKRSIRLLSIVGGLVMPLGILFTSFATEFGQVVFSYGIVFGVGVAMVREASTVMLGNYFKRRRQFVEMVAMSGEGVGIALFSVILKEGVGKAGWRLGLQIVAALTALSFFMGLMYRPASLYHPQRRAIQHLKNQRKKMREKKPILSQEVESTPRYLFLDISSLKSVTVKILLMTSSVASFGIYTPMFLMALNAAEQGSDVQELVLLQTFLGISMALGVVIAGALLRRCFVIRHFVINTKIVTQLFISIVALAILFLSFVMGYTGLCILSWLYGIGLGGFQYSLKILALERIKLKHFSKAWGFIRGVESVPVLISVPLTSFLNDYSLKYGRAGYYICSAAAAISGIIIFFISEPQHQQQQQHHQQQQQQQQQMHHHYQHRNGHLPTPMLVRHSSARQHRPHIPQLDYGYGEYPAPDLLSRSCISLNQMEPYLQTNYCQRHMLQQHQQQQQQQQQHSHLQQLACQNLDVQQQQQHQVRGAYQLGQGSIGARMGKRLQRSLSFIQQHNCCEGQNMYCSWHSTYELGCHKSNKSPALDRQPLICTCSSPNNNPTTYGQTTTHSTRSRSVPEGLSTMSQQCNCRHGSGTIPGLGQGPGSGPTREFIYVPHAYASLQRTPTHRQGQRSGEAGSLGGGGACSALRSNPQCRLKRSQSLCRPTAVQFVEQITTSV
ncbi:uncharacterized protein Dana_GF15251 [Drosophila ananassae]|uniref:Major facilitator superfamily (MFS) profile domain-containing protein n=1 Tax=Drosophila ananassae TaxID=7217 RepID=B3MP65_DROAN|nr:uncharacterized protein Dana_GF15251 [Drosophila ananassae]